MSMWTAGCRGTIRERGDKAVEERGGGGAGVRGGGER